MADPRERSTGPTGSRRANLAVQPSIEGIAMQSKIWLIVLGIGAIASVVAAIAEWRIVKKTGRLQGLWGAGASLGMGLLLFSYMIGSR